MPTYTPIQSIELTSDEASVTFSNIPQNYQDLVISINGCAATTGDVGFSCVFNEDTSSLYSMTYLLGSGTAPVQTARVANQGSAWCAYGTGWSTNLNNRSMTTVNLQNYSNTTTFKPVLSQSNVTNGSYPGTELLISVYRSTSAITSIKFIGYSTMKFATGTTFNIYGISPVAANNTQAFGGTDIFYDSSYVYHVFKASGTFTPNRNLSVDYLVVAGGGGAASDANGGGAGGAGGLRGGTQASVVAGTSYAITVGAGGPGAIGQTNGTKGSNSSIVGGSSSPFSGGGFVTTGGGRAKNQAVAATGAGDAGGSGAGGSSTSGAGTYAGGAGNEGGYSPSEGNSGGSGLNTGGQFPTGGGGGAGAVGGNGSGTQSGAGGIGSSTYSSWGLATGTGENVAGTYYYAGGGGGGATLQGATRGLGGSGGGGSGGISGSSGNSGLTNTGGGGGGGSNSTPANGGAGGSGIVIVRYAR